MSAGGWMHHHHAGRRYAAVLPAILIALLIDGVARGLLPRDTATDMAIWVLIFAIGVSDWVQYARTVRGSTLVEKNKEYVQAARLIGIQPGPIMCAMCCPT
jgi:peptide/nickel transport system permease protein